jgi:hypothetical protein
MSRSVLAAAAVLSLAATAANAAVINFDPDGPGPAAAAPIGSLDFLPGNALLVASPAASAGTLYYQARLGAVLNAAGQVVPTPGLNAPATAPGANEITAVLAVPVLLAPSTSSPFPTVTFANFGGAVGGYLSIYFDTTPDANDLAGTGFRDGVKIFDGQTVGALGSATGFPGSTVPLDGFGPDNYPGTTATVLAGGYKVGGDGSANPAFFPGSDALSALLDSTFASPFVHVDPSAQFEIGPDGSTIILPVVSSDFGPSRAESDGAIAFTPVPEPTALSLLSLGLLAFRRTRRAS